MKTLKQCLFILAIASLSLTNSQILIGGDSDSGNFFLWETHINGATIYIAGSVHVGKTGSYPLDKPYMRCLSGSDKLILEIEEDFETINTRMMDYIRKDHLPENKYFRDNLNQDSKDKIIEILGIDKFHKFDQYNAWVLITQLTVNKMRLLDYEPSLAVDRYIRDQAVSEGKEIMGLEEIEEQFKLLEFDLPYEVQLKVIEGTINNIREAAEKEAVLYDAYFNNQLEIFEEAFTKRFDLENPAESAVYNKIFIERNKTWVSRLEELVDNTNETVFVLVGAGHLFGQENLLDCLREKGYTINQVNK